jgi:hypothetical protein
MEGWQGEPLGGGVWSDTAEWERRLTPSGCVICASARPNNVIGEMPPCWVTAQLRAPVRFYVCIVARNHVVEPYEMTPSEQADGSDRVSSVELTDDPVQRPEDFDLAESWREIADEVDRKRTPLEIQAICAPHGIGKLRMVLGDRLEVGGSTTDGRIEVVIRGYNEYALAGELAGLIEWVEVTGPPGVRDHLASIGNALAKQYG